MRVSALDEGSFSKQDRSALLVGCVLDENRIAGIVTSTVTVDGIDGTKQALALLRRCNDINLVILGSVSLAGFNSIDPYAIHTALAVPVIVANPQQPRLDEVRKALRKHFDDWQRRATVFERTATFRKMRVRGGGVIYYHAVGVQPTAARHLLRRLIIFGNRPEPLRVVRIIARTLSEWPFLQAHQVAR